MLTVEMGACVWKIETSVNCTPAALKIKRSEGRRLAHILVARGLRTAAERKFNSVCQAFHTTCRVHPQDFNRQDTIPANALELRGAPWRRIIVSTTVTCHARSDRSA